MTLPPLSIDPDIARASTLPAEVYRDPRYFDLARERVFTRTWQFLGEVGVLTESGSVAPFTLLEGLLNEPILLTRDAAGEIRALSIVCTHRGNVLAEAPCRTPAMRCRYHGRKIAGYYYWLFPNTMFNFYPWGISINLVQPLAPDRTRVRYLAYVGDRSRLGKGAGGSLDRVEREDEAIVERVQQGIASRFYGRGRYSPRHERGVHHFHRLLARFLTEAPEVPARTL
ncbi:MAG: Rieske 2Fe-2S domain-containing protein [Planctomycetes bacterium]|nr:Rieske 2Fe-2S domain-containing protein [Planctomycetota bacterium]